MKQEYHPNLIRFSRCLGHEVYRYTSLHLVNTTDFSVTAWASDADLETFKLNGWAYALIK